MIPNNYIFFLFKDKTSMAIYPIIPDNRFMEQFPILYDAHTMMIKLMDFV